LPCTAIRFSDTLVAAMSASSSPASDAIWPAYAAGWVSRLAAAIPDVIVAASFAQHYLFGTPPPKNEFDPMARLLMGEFLLIHSTIFLAPFIAMLWLRPAGISPRALIACILGFGAFYSLLAWAMGNVWLFWMLCGRRAFAMAESRRAFDSGQDEDASARFWSRWKTEMVCFIASSTLCVVVLQGRGPGRMAWSTLCAWGFLHFSAMAVITVFDLWIPDLKEASTRPRN
jgi:hypothetical protein